MTLRFVVLGLCLLLVACGDDGGATPDGATMCATDIDCSDGTFCSGVERCAPTDPGADARGCVSGTDPCFEGQECSESEARCVTVDCSLGDIDGDGVESIDCGGTDCDDADADRFPGNPEICDDAAHDEDCDPETLGGDMDGDGYAPLECCNGSRCGQDCDDSRDGVSPEAVEACNGIDEDCDGDLDEGAQQLFFRDLDGDGFGDPATGVMRACVDDPIFSTQADDCDDRDAATNPGASEICDGRDNDCNAATPFDDDRDGDGHLRPDAPCTGGELPLDDCDDSNPFAHGGAVERCSGVDDDCDGTVDEAAADAWCTEQARLTGDTGASALCGAGATCSLSACAAGTADCDGLTGNGCEVDTLTDAANCGGCLLACSSGICDMGVCVPAADTALPTAFTSVAVGVDGACALTNDKRALCWGDSLPLVLATRPRFLSNSAGPLTDIEEVAVVDDCLCARVTSGQILCQGTASLDPAEPNACNGTGVLLGGGTNPFIINPLPILDSGGTPLIASRLVGGGDRACAVVASVTVGGTTVSDGVVCWGLGPLGDGTTNGSSIPVPVVDTSATPAPIGGVTDISAGEETVCAIDGAGVVRCWGGQKDVLSQDDAAAGPVQRAGGGTLVANRVAVGADVACAIDDTDVAFCWGDNQEKQLQPELDDITYPLAASIDGTWAELAPDRGVEGGRPRHSCGRKTNGDVECWGDNVSEVTAPVLGCRDLDRCTVQSPTLIGESVATDPVDGVPATSIGSGSGFSCGIFDGWPWCWGVGPTGELGARVGAIPAAYPVPIPGLEPPVQVESTLNGACARTADGSIACWGLPGLRGAPTNGTEEDREINRKDAAIRLRGLPPAVDFDVGQAITCAVGTDGQVRCIGVLDPGLGIDDAGSIVEVGFLGDVSPRGPDDPYVIPGLTDVRDVELGSLHACALKTDGTVWCWGVSQNGATGEVGSDDCGGTPCTLTPRQVTGLHDRTVIPNPAPVAELALGGFVPFGIGGYSCARLTDGRVACWGTNNNGALGDGTLMSSATPVLVSGLEDAVELEASAFHVCALRSDGSQVCWGPDAGGTLGTTSALMSCGLLPCSPVPVRSIGVADTEVIGIGFNRSCAATSSGSIFCWGGGESFVGDTGPVPSAPVPGVAFPTELVGGLDGHCALAGDAVRCWGSSRSSVNADSFPDAPERYVPPSYVPGL